MTDQIFNPDDFFAPAPTGLVENLIGNYKHERQKIDSLAMIMSDSESLKALHYFLRGNLSDKNLRIPPSGKELFSKNGAVAHLNAAYWQKALQMTDVQDYMPAQRREEWYEQIRNPQGIPAPRISEYDRRDGKVQSEWNVEPLPDFDEDTVRATMLSLLNSRSQFFSERVDGVFKALSGEHVTNRPEGFGRRMILSRVYDQWGMNNSDMVGYIHDLRQILAKFMGRPAPSYDLTSRALKIARRTPGEWTSIDGGEMRICAYLKGTAHFEVHPEMAWRLNCILASIYPRAIPPEFRTKPKKKLKNFVLVEDVLPVSVLEDLCRLEIDEYKTIQREKYSKPIEPKTQNPYNRIFRGSEPEKHVRTISERVLTSIGGTKFRHNNWKWWEFEYDPTRALNEIIASGCMPNDISYQFYPTSPELAEYCVKLAGIESHHRCLEPSAGLGGLAKFMPPDQTICVEISPLRCQVLGSKGYRVYEADFLKWAAASGGCFDRIVMNPPLSEGRGLAHLQAAAELTKPGSRIVAIMLAGMRGKKVLSDEWNCTWSEPRTGEFSGVSAPLVILTAERQWKK